MPKQIIPFLLFLFLFSAISFAQERKESFIASSFYHGLPKEIPLKWQNTLYSSINVGGYFKSLFIVSRDSLKTSENCFLFLVNENGFSRNAISFEKAGENNYKAKIFLSSQEEDKLSPLKLVLNLVEKSLKYRWDNKNEIAYENPTIIEEYQLKIGKIFPQIDVETAEGIWSSNKRNKIVVINWWATSCLPCIEEMPGLNELVNKYPKAEFIAIVWDKKNLSSFISKHKFNYEQGYGTEKLTHLFGDVFPRHIIVNKEGIVLFNKLGGSKDINLELEKVIKENL